MSVINRYFRLCRWVYVCCFLVLINHVPGLHADNSNTHKDSAQHIRYSLTIIIPSDTAQLKINEHSDLLADFLNNLIIVQVDDNRILKISENAKSMADIGGFGFGTGQFNYPLAAASSDGGLNLILLDSENRRIVRLSSSLNWIDQFPLDQEIDGKAVDALTGLAVNSAGDIYISDPRNSRVLRFDQFGEFQSELQAKGGFLSPGRLAVDNQDFLYVCDHNHNDIAVFDDLGNYISQFGIGIITSPDIVKADDQYIYIGDQTAGVVYVFDFDYQFICLIKNPRTTEKKGNFPAAMAPSANGRLWIADSHSNRIYGYDPVDE